MSVKAKVPPKAKIVISNNTITHEPFQVNEHVAGAMKAIAEAATANARAIERLAERVCGPLDNSYGISLSGIE